MQGFRQAQFTIDNIKANCNYEINERRTKYATRINDSNEGATTNL